MQDKDRKLVDAEKRRKDIEFQLSESKYGIAYTDGTERITQLNRPVVSVLCTIFIAVLICSCAGALALKFIFWLLG